jgi:hypothetical protein
MVSAPSAANGAINVRLPRSVHAALLAEAMAEGVSLNQLCLCKLVAQLQAVIQRPRCSCRINWPHLKSGGCGIRNGTM